MDNIFNFEDRDMPSPEEVLEEMKKSGKIDDATYQEIKYRFEDIEDNFNMNSYEIYKKAYQNDRLNKCVEVLMEMGETETDNFKRSFLLSNALKNPMGYKFNDKEYKKTMSILTVAIKKAEEQKLSEAFIKNLEEMFLYNYVLFKNNKNNTEKLIVNKFSEESLSRQLRMICIFIQDQSRLMKNQLSNSRKERSFVTGMEMDVADRMVDYAPNQKVSLSDNYEGMLEYFDTFIRYLYAVKKEDLKKIDTTEHGDIHPFNLPSLEEVTYIAQQRAMYVKLEEKFRYSQWELSSGKTVQGQDVCVFSPANKEKYKAHLVAATRRKYHYSVRIMQKTNLAEIEKALSNIEMMASKIDIDAIEEFAIDRESFSKAKKIVEPMISAYKSLTKSYYFECTFNKMKVEDLLMAYEFLYTYSQIYITAVLNHFDEKDYSDYKYLAPIFSFEYISDTFSKLYEIQKDKAKKILKCFVYDESIRNDEGDIFSRPLIKVNDSQILFCESLVEQINIDRAVEQILQKYKVDLAPVGTEFEKKLIDKLKRIPSIEVNTNHVVFTAYDEKDVEFDFLGILEDNLLLFEFKSVLTPYDDNEVYKREKIIKEGVEQVCRRSEVIKHDWEKIRERVNIQLPQEPYSEDKIIKVVCTNIYDFTTLKMEGVRITDESTLLKYFTDPLVGVMSVGKESTQVLDAEFIWKSGKPTVNEFKAYLDSPVTVGNLSTSFVDELKMIPVFEGDYCIGFNDLILKEDPYRKAINTKRQIVKDKKVYPNEPCPCNSGKKYKKCCGRK